MSTRKLILTALVCGIATGRIGSTETRSFDRGDLLMKMSRLKMRLFLLAAALSALFVECGESAAAPLTVLATGALGAPLQKIAEDFSKRSADNYVSGARAAGMRASTCTPSSVSCTSTCSSSAAAAMIASVAWHRLRSDGVTALDIGADPNLQLPVVP